MSAAKGTDAVAAEREHRAGVARERDHDDVGAFADDGHVAGSRVAGRDEEAHELADWRLTIRNRSPDLGAVVPVAAELRRGAALAAQPVPVLNSARRIPASVDVFDQPQRVLDRPVP